MRLVRESEVLLMWLVRESEELLMWLVRENRSAPGEACEGKRGVPS